MTKPSITKRSVKGAALTYSELDTNFQNLADATVSLTAGSGGTQVTSDLNGNITLVAGTGITLSGNNSAKTITITGTNTGLTDIVNDTSPQLGGDLDVNGYKLISTANGNIELNPDGTGQIRLIADGIIVGDGVGTVTINTNSGQVLQLRDPFVDDSALALGANGVVSYGNVTILGTTLSISGSGGSSSYVTTDSNGQTLYLKTNGTSSSAQISVGAGTNGSVVLVGNGTGKVFSNSEFVPNAGINVASGYTVKVNSKQAVNGPAFSAYATNSLQTITSGSQQKVLFQTEEFDTNNNYASSRFTPTVEGYYQLNSSVRIDGATGTGEIMIVIWKNGSEYKRGTNQQGTQVAADFWEMNVSSIVYANGSTDYFEIYVQQTSGASRTITAVASPAITYFNGCMVRGA